LRKFNLTLIQKKTSIKEVFIFKLNSVYTRDSLEKPVTLRF
jgi:hypothetical protein